MSNKIKQVAITLFLSFCLLTACDEFSGAKIPLPNDVLIGGLHRSKPLFIYSYGPAFAQRFGLSKNKAIPLDPGLSAIAFEMRPQVGQIDCYVHLYLDETVNVYVPQNRINFTIQGVEERIFAKQFNDEDSDLRGSLDYRMAIVYRSKSLAKGTDGDMYTLSYTQVKSNFLPKLKLVTLHLGCAFPHNKYGPTEIIIQKAGTEDYVLGGEDQKNMHNDKTYGFSIPPKLQQHLQPYLEYANKFNAMKNSSINFNPPEPTIEFP